jgi:hypothetical protein
MSGNVAIGATCGHLPNVKLENSAENTIRNFSRQFEQKFLAPIWTEIWRHFQTQISRLFSQPVSMWLTFYLTGLARLGSEPWIFLFSFIFLPWCNWKWLEGVMIKKWLEVVSEIRLYSFKATWRLKYIYIYRDNACNIAWHDLLDRVVHQLVYDKTGCFMSTTYTYSSWLFLRSPHISLPLSHCVYK